LNNTKVDIVHPEAMVPIARRLRDFIRFLFSSLVGDKDLKEGTLPKQNKIIRREYTAVRRVATRDMKMLKKLDNLVKEVSRIRSLE
jgi:hypothetical protein